MADQLLLCAHCVVRHIGVTRHALLDLGLQVCVDMCRSHFKWRYHRSDSDNPSNQVLCGICLQLSPNWPDVALTILIGGTKCQLKAS